MERRTFLRGLAVAGTAASNSFAQQTAATGEYELFKVSAHFDGTARHPDWTGGDDPAVQKLAPQPAG